jgi:hypothetical protein
MLRLVQWGLSDEVDQCRPGGLPPKAPTLNAISEEAYNKRQLMNALATGADA